MYSFHPGPLPSLFISLKTAQMPELGRRAHSCYLLIFSTVVKVHYCFFWVNYARLLYFHFAADDDDDAEVSLSTVLSFFTGADVPPPLGFHPATLKFSEVVAEFPTASSCALELTLPTKHHNNPDMFREKFVYALKHHGGFGLHWETSMHFLHYFELTSLFCRWVPISMYVCI